MKRRITTGWTPKRWVYLLMGLAILGQSVYDQVWFGVALGAYLTLMGTLGLGCASGQCTVPQSPRRT